MKIRKADYGDEQDLLAFMELIDHSFAPPLSTSVDLGLWLKKVLRLGMVLVSGKQKNLKGVIAFYCNDRENWQAFITLLGIAKPARRQGIGRRLLEEAIIIFRREGMKSALVTTWAANRAAISLYEACGFQVDVMESKRSGKIALRLTI